MIRLNGKFEGIKGTVWKPERGTTSKGTPFVKFQLSTFNRKGEDGKASYSYWNCIMWDDVLIPEKTLIVVDEATLNTRSYEKDGQKRVAVEMTVYKCHEVEANHAGNRNDGPAFTPLGGAPNKPENPFNPMGEGFSPIENDGELPF